MTLPAGQRDLTLAAKRLLWERYGSETYRSEWDGLVYGGGKISQRFWEYFIALELLELREESVVLDIGGGSPVTGVSLFGRVLADLGVSVVVMDEHFGSESQFGQSNVTLVPGRANAEDLSRVLRDCKPTHIASVSVLEHASREEQIGIFDAIERHFDGETVVMTFEFHERVSFVEQMMTTPTLSPAVSRLKRFFLDRIERSPVNCDNAVTDQHVRLWYPLALRFRSAAGLNRASG